MTTIVTMDTVVEHWIPVIGYEGCYEVSRTGEVRSLTRSVSCGKGVGQILGCVLKPWPSGPNGYPTVKLSKNGIKKTHLVHQLMLTSFVGPRPPGMESCHQNDVSTDNRIENLRWDTHSQNMVDVVKNGNHAHANKTRCDNGHDFTAENTIITTKGRRNCRTCKNLDSRRRYAGGRTNVRAWNRVTP